MFFIVGSARSGTTLLRMLLNAHPQVAVPPESRFITELYSGDEVGVSEFLRRLESHQRFARWELSIDEVAVQLEGRDRAPFVEAIDAVYRAYAQARGKIYWGDKTPRYVENIPLLSKLWPRARFVHMVRDGRAVALSYADVSFGPTTVARAARLWSTRVRQGMLAGRSLPAGRYHELHYEALVEEPEAEIRILCRFLGFRYDASMFDYVERSRGEVLDRARASNPNVTSPIHLTRSWREQMPLPQVEAFEAVAGDVLSDLGYERACPAPGLGARLSAALGLAGLPVGRLRSSAAARPPDDQPSSSEKRT